MLPSGAVPRSVAAKLCFCWCVNAYCAGCLAVSTRWHSVVLVEGPVRGHPNSVKAEALLPAFSDFSGPLRRTTISHDINITFCSMLGDLERVARGKHCFHCLTKIV